MDESPVKAEEKRKPDGTFGPGNNANPHGRPLKKNTFSDIARALLEAREINIEYTFPKAGQMVTSKLHMESDSTINHSLIAALIKEGLDGNVNAIKELIDRTEGKAIETVKHEGGVDNIVGTYNFNGMNPDELRKIRDTLRDARQPAEPPAEIS